MTDRMESWIAYKEFTRRGCWATYSDMQLFLRNLEVLKLWNIFAECTWKVKKIVSPSPLSEGLDKWLRCQALVLEVHGSNPAMTWLKITSLLSLPYRR